MSGKVIWGRFPRAPRNTRDLTTVEGQTTLLNEILKDIGRGVYSLSPKEKESEPG